MRKVIDVAYWLIPVDDVKLIKTDKKVSMRPLADGTYVYPVSIDKASELICVKRVTVWVFTGGEPRQIELFADDAEYFIQEYCDNVEIINS